MTKRTNKTAKPTLTVVLPETGLTVLADMGNPDAKAALDALTPVQAPGPKTVVRVAYKHRYQDQAKARGLTDKASKRGNGDWLQRELQAETIGAKGIFDFDRFLAILNANGVDHSRWKTEGNGWQGRFRMSGSICLRGIVGKTGVFRTPDAAISVQEQADAGDEQAQTFLAKWAN